MTKGKGFQNISFILMVGTGGNSIYTVDITFYYQIVINAKKEGMHHEDQVMILFLNKNCHS